MGNDSVEKPTEINRDDAEINKHVIWNRDGLMSDSRITEATQAEAITEETK